MLDDAPLVTVAPREGEGEPMEEAQASARRIAATRTGVHSSAKEITEGLAADAKVDQGVDATQPARDLRTSSSGSTFRSPKAGTAKERDVAREVDVTAYTAQEEPSLINEFGHVAPGPPPTSTVGTVSSVSTLQNGVTADGPVPKVADADDLQPTAREGLSEPPLSGYALAFRTHKIPPARFQIDPAIPTSMLRARSTKKRTHAGAFGRPQPAITTNGASTPATVIPVRSSPRNGKAVNGSGNPGMVDKPDTPGASVRRSGRVSKLAMELVGLDGANDEGDGLKGRKEEMVEDDHTGSGSGGGGRGRNEHGNDSGGCSTEDESEGAASPPDADSDSDAEVEIPAEEEEEADDDVEEDDEAEPPDDEEDDDDEDDELVMGDVDEEEEDDDDDDDG